MNFESLENAPRLLMEARLEPIQGHRFQPTGFPDLGAAEYSLPDGQRGLLVESAQSMANRLEAAIWDEGSGDLVESARGLPYVRATLPDGSTTNSILEAHRLNSPYLVNSPEFKQIEEAIGYDKNKPFDRRTLARVLLRFDPNSLVHGIFLEKIGGVLRLPRALTAFIEAEDVNVAPSGGVKVDRVQPGTGENTEYGKANEGYGNVPYHRDEYVASTITAYFNLDLSLLRGYGLSPAARALVIGLSLYKIQALLHSGLRLRTACDLDLREVVIRRPEGFTLPDQAELESALPKFIEACADEFANPRVLEVTYQSKSKKK